MHPAQQTLLRQAESLNDKLGGTSPMWKYVCPETNKTFYLTEKRMTIRSPFTGKTFTTRPERYTLSDVGKELRQPGEVSEP